MQIALARDLKESGERGNRARIQGLVNRLTPREREVMELVVAGLMNKQIAERKGLAVQTVKIHRGRMMHKMGVDSLAGLLHLVG